uniref:Uncharacterized protein n=1 Tax=Lepeophtheirus salmonis TaxID=72036 RepID=A0A0K2TQH6_LEPSM
MHIIFIVSNFSLLKRKQ